MPNVTKKLELGFILSENISQAKFDSLPSNEELALNFIEWLEKEVEGQIDFIRCEVEDVE